MLTFEPFLRSRFCPWTRRTGLSSPRWAQERYGEGTPFSVRETLLSAPASPAYGAALLLLGFEKSLQVPRFPQPEKGRREENIFL